MQVSSCVNAMFCTKVLQKEAYESLKEILYNDSAVAGEAAGLAMGLIMLGRPTNDIKDEMLLYAHETQHEKIIRGLAIGIALLYYGRQEESNQVVKNMCDDGVSELIDRLCVSVATLTFRILLFGTAVCTLLHWRTQGRRTKKLFVNCCISQSRILRTMSAEPL
jgi:hypothetical protein